LITDAVRDTLDEDGLRNHILWCDAMSGNEKDDWAFDE
jgi:hypothetical protein